MGIFRLRIKGLCKLITADALRKRLHFFNSQVGPSSEVLTPIAGCMSILCSPCFEKLSSSVGVLVFAESAVGSLLV